MNLKRPVLYAAFGVYQIAAFIFTILVDGHLDLLGLLRFIPWFKYLSFIGLVLITVDIVWYWMDRRANKQQCEQLEKENLHLKAKLYDYQNAEKTDAQRKS